MEAGRLEAFSDGVIAVIITIMVLELKPPAIAAPAALLEQWHVFVAYALSFLLVAIYWVNHHHLLYVARRIGARSLWLNIHWLFWLSLYPFVTAYVGTTAIAPFAMALYAALSALTALAYLLLARDLSGRNAHVPVVRSLTRSRQRKTIAAILVNVTAIPLAYLSVYAALALVAVPAAAFFWPSRKVD